MMHVRKTAIALIASLGLMGCQTVNGIAVAGYDPPANIRAAQGESFCARNTAVCVLGVVVVVGAVAFAASGGGGGGGY